jgi:hypothetical protein
MRMSVASISFNVDLRHTCRAVPVRVQGQLVICPFQIWQQMLLTHPALLKTGQQSLSHSCLHATHCAFNIRAALNSILLRA